MTLGERIVRTIEREWHRGRGVEDIAAALTADGQEFDAISVAEVLLGLGIEPFDKDGHFIESAVP